MADPLSLAAAIAGLVTLGLTATEYFVSFYTRYKDRDRSIARTTRNLEELLFLLRSIHDEVETRSGQADQQEVLVHIRTYLDSCQSIIDEMQEEKAKFTKVPEHSIIGTIRFQGRKAAYPIRHSTLNKLDEDVNAFRDQLMPALILLGLESARKLEDDVEENNMILKDLLSLTISDNLRGWLRAPDATVDYNNAISKRYTNTGSWFVRGDQFTTWLQQNNSFLWLYGFSGCGKSVLFSTAIRHTIFHKQTQDHSAIAFFFFSFNDKMKQDASAMLRALLFQLCGQISGVEGDLVRLKKFSNDGTPSVEVLQQYLKQAISRADHVYILLDAIDECPDDDQQREVLLSLIDTMKAWSLAGLHLLVTSRDLIGIRQALNAAASEQVTFDNPVISQDIAEFVSYKLKRDPQLQRWKGHGEKIEERLSKQANGVFRWVDCQLGALSKCPASLDDLEKCLRSLPATLDKTYERMLCSIEKNCKDRARQLLALLCFSSRPLSVAEVIDALAVDVEHDESFDPGRRVQSFQDLLLICPGFIDVHPPQHSRDSYVRITHFSVQEYLLSSQIEDGLARYFKLTPATGHALLSKTCLIYLCDEQFLKQTLSQELLNQYPLANFSSQFWNSYYGHVEGSETVSLDRLVVNLLTDKHSFDRCIQLHKPDEPLRRKKLEKLMNHAEPLYYVALLGMYRIVWHLVHTVQKNVDAQGGIYGNALQAASSRGHEQVVKMLLDNGAKIHAEGGYYGDALQAASSRGHERVVQILLDNGANIEADGEDYYRALYTASYEGQEQVVQVLLKNKANVNAQGEGGDALQAASSRGHMQIVLKLLENGAKVDGKGGRYGYALHAASYGGYEPIVLKLLESGAKVGDEGGIYGYALQAASYGGHEPIVQVLLTKEADVNAQGGTYGNALQAASYRGHEHIVQKLLENGANVNAQGGEYGNALRAALYSGQQQVARMLLSKGAVRGDLQAR